MADEIVFQIDRKSGVRGTFIRTPQGIMLVAAKMYDRDLKAKDTYVSEEHLRQFVAEARKRNGDGDVEILIDRCPLEP